MDEKSNDKKKLKSIEYKNLQKNYEWKKIKIQSSLFRSLHDLLLFLSR